ncbi:MAG: RNA pseudouridine synthase [Eubacteriales bacterium]|nr:RNA pseudouridine synthase [Eubacteriales bacterium]
MEPQVIYEDREILVCRKPAGVAVESARIGEMDLVSVLRNYLADGKGIPYLGVVHRLDQPVQGVMVFAKTKGSAAKLSAQAADGRMKKIYWALAEGEPSEEEGHLVNWLLKDGRTNMSRIVMEGTKGAKRAELNYRVLEQREGCALLEVELLTGRHHQIRVQMAGAGMPLVGDRKYGKEKAQGAEHVALWAVKLEFTHPGSGKRMRFEWRPEEVGELRGVE